MRPGGEAVLPAYPAKSSDGAYAEGVPHGIVSSHWFINITNRGFSEAAEAAVFLYLSLHKPSPFPLTRGPLSLKMNENDPMRSDDVTPETWANATCTATEIYRAAHKS